MKNIFLAVLLTSILGAGLVPRSVKAADDSQETISLSNFSVPWCRDVASILWNALHNGWQAQDYPEEISILLRATSEALTQSGRHQFYLKETLGMLLKDISIYSEEESQVFLARRYLKDAIYDLWIFDLYQSHRNYGPYIVELLRRGQREGLRAPQNSEEITFLTRSLQRALKLLEKTDFGRTGSYSCAKLSIKEALDLSSNLQLSEITRIEVLRTGTEEAIEKLSYGQCSN